jgi:XTP/dITP diphosphohydrolase
MRLSNRLVLASLNRHKFEEFKSILSAYPEIELIQAERLLRNPEGLKYAEHYNTYLENAVAKARLVNLGTHYPSLADDSGLEVLALEGKPGVKSHRYAPAKQGFTQDEANNERLLTELRGKGQREARFTCTVALVIEGILLHATATLDGSIADSPRGEHGFGYDPLFIPRGADRTLAQMSAAEKNQISHRAKAIHDLISQIKRHGIAFAKP